MKTLSINIISVIKWFISAIKSGSGPVTSPKTQEMSFGSPAENMKIDSETKENFDLALFQRKAYCGNFFVGPYVIFNPDLFK